MWIEKIFRVRKDIIQLSCLYINIILKKQNKKVKKKFPSSYSPVYFMKEIQTKGERKQ